ncbi:MAG: hypothetical protein ACJAZ0_001223 [Halioglobus sp.]|jgi:hypothetical protein
MLKKLTSVSALSLFMAVSADAVTVNVDNHDYEVVTVIGTFNDLWPTLNTQEWWGDEHLAEHLAATPVYTFQYPNVLSGHDVRYAWSGYENGMDGVAWSWNTSMAAQGAAVGLSPHNETFTWAVAAPVAEVPLPAAGWLFMSALIGLMGKKRLSRRSVH